MTKYAFKQTCTKLKNAKYESRLMTKLLQGTAHTSVISPT